jgi:drug/metabolite transporter (DMT)-like permease
VQLIFNTSPLMTSLLASALLGAEPPLRLLPTLLLTIAGTGARLRPPTARPHLS